MERTYGIGNGDYEAMLEAQGGRCAICRQPESIEGWHLGVDHDHATGAVRGLLCRSCNLLLGYAKDRPSLLRRCIAYLEEHAV